MAVKTHSAITTIRFQNTFFRDEFLGKRLGQAQKDANGNFIIPREDYFAWFNYTIKLRYEILYRTNGRRLGYEKAWLMRLERKILKKLGLDGMQT